jgi:hypothetical protein
LRVPRCSRTCPASDITVGKADYRRLICASQSAKCVAAYLYSAAGPGRVDDGPRVGRPRARLRKRRTPRRVETLPARSGA